MRKALMTSALLIAATCVVLMVSSCTKANDDTAVPVDAPRMADEASMVPGTGGDEGTDEGAAAPDSAFTYVCLDHPDETSDKPARCPVCDEIMSADTDEEVEYYCETHPEATQADPGECEACGGMILAARVLEPAEGTVGDDDDDDDDDDDEGSGDDDEDDDDEGSGDDDEDDDDEGTA